MRAFAISTRSAVFALAALAGAAGPALADPADEVYEILQLDALMEVMRDEGLASGDDMAANMGLRADQSWRDRVAAIYDVDAMGELLRDGIAGSFDAQYLPALTDFFTSEPGSAFIAYEIAARRALLDPDVEEAAMAAAAEALAAESDRINLISSYILANDIIESNVMGGMNGSFAFYRGMRAGGAIPDEVSDEILLQDVWQQEDILRQNTTEWAYSYLYMAYAPATDADLEAYIAFSESDAGQEMTSSLFAAFDVLFNTMSEAMGLAVAQRMATQEL